MPERKDAMIVGLALLGAGGLMLLHNGAKPKPAPGPTPGGETSGGAAGQDPGPSGSGPGPAPAPRPAPLPAVLPPTLPVAAIKPLLGPSLVKQAAQKAVQAQQIAQKALAKPPPPPPADYSVRNAVGAQVLRTYNLTAAIALAVKLGCGASVYVISKRANAYVNRACPPPRPITTGQRSGPRSF